MFEPNILWTTWGQPMSFWFRKNKIVYLGEKDLDVGRWAILIAIMATVAIAVFLTVNWIRG